MEVVKIIEKENGGAELILDMTEEEQRTLIEYAVVDILKNKLNALEDELKDQGRK